MGTGSKYDSTNKTGSFDSINHKSKLIDSGSVIRGITPIGGGQDSFANSTSGGMYKGSNYEANATGTLWQSKLASLKWASKWGHLQFASATWAECAHGLLAGAGITGSLSAGTMDTTDGRPLNFTSTAGAGDQTGFRMTNAYTIRKFNPAFKVTWKLDESAANIRFFAGFTASGSLIGNSDDPLNALEGFGIGVVTTQANYRLLRNDGVGATSTTDTGVAKDTAFHTFEAWADDNSTQFLWSLDGSTPAIATTDIPAQTTNLFSQVTATAVNADAKVMSITRALITSDR